jgi:hypothetical protein
LETEQKRLRAVLDTNIFVAAYLSKNPHSPTIELLRRWRQGYYLLNQREEVGAREGEFRGRDAVMLDVGRNVLVMRMVGLQLCRY